MIAEAAALNATMARQLVLRSAPGQKPDDLAALCSATVGAALACAQRL